MKRVGANFRVGCGASEPLLLVWEEDGLEGFSFKWPQGSPVAVAAESASQQPEQE